jgi:eukaryotic-like serine/threonine-protein kinase
LARPAAVKLIKAQALGAGSSGADLETARVRFAREAQAIARLSSPHTVQLYDFGIADSGDFYYVMELLAGFTMEQLVERYGQIDPARVIYLLVQAAESLAEAHQAGLVHRDVKPANIFVCRYGTRYDFVKVLDFGLVKDRRREVPSVTVTNNGTITGTPAYMAPEVALGKANVDARADIYALGCVAFWLLTGQHVFEGDTVMEVLVRHVNVAPPSIHSFVEEPLPQGLEEAIQRCLAKNPDERPQTMDELIHELLSVKCQAPWNFARARRWWEAHVPDAPAIGATGADSAVRDRAIDDAVAVANAKVAATKP